MAIGTVKGFEVGPNRDGTKDVILLQVEIYKNDIQTVELMSSVGDDTIPPNESRVMVLSVGGAWKIAIASNDGIKSTMEAGEKKLYSSVNGTIKAWVSWLINGILRLNGTGDFAIRFNEMEKSFDKLKDDNNNNWTKYSSHTHQDSLSAPTGPPSVLATPSAASMSAAKVDNVELPS